MAVYTHLSDTDLDAIGSQYGLRVRAASPLDHGSANTNLRLDTDRGPFVLTLIEDSTLARTLDLARLLRVLDGHGFPTTTPFPACSGALATTYGGQPVLVKPYLEGDVCPDASDAILEQVGDALAQLHAIPPPPSLHGRRARGAWKVTPAVTVGLDAEVGWDVGARIEALDVDARHDLPRGLVHGDVCDDNILVRDGRLVAVIDFEEALVAPLVFDVGMAIVGLCHTDDGVDPDRARALVRGYATRRALSREERRALQGAAEVAALLIACWRYWKVVLDVPDPSRRARPFAMLRVAEAIRAMPAHDWEAIGLGRRLAPAPR